jgi:hypothetical protein
MLQRRGPGAPRHWPFDLPLTQLGRRHRVVQRWSAYICLNAFRQYSSASARDSTVALKSPQGARIRAIQGPAGSGRTVRQTAPSGVSWIAMRSVASSFSASRTGRRNASVLRRREQHLSHTSRCSSTAAVSALDVRSSAYCSSNSSGRCVKSNYGRKLGDRNPAAVIDLSRVGTMLSVPPSEDGCCQTRHRGLMVSIGGTWFEG